jgi:ABC-type branched-subunit amino acid transport system permease subunit
VNPLEFYAIVLLIYFGTDVLAAWGLNVQFGVGGVANLAYVVVVAAGAYTYAVLSLGSPSDNGGFQHYILGFSLPFVVAVPLAGLVGAAVGMLIGITGLRRLRPDYQALVMLVVSLMAATVVTADVGLFNGNAGLSLVPNPFIVTGDDLGYWSYVAVVGLAVGIGWLVMRRFTTGPMGRTLRAMRDDENAAAAVGKSVVNLRLLVQAVGGAFGGVSGALLVAFVGGWSPAAWAAAETLALLTAVIVGGMGSDIGVTVGTFLVAVLILQGVQFLPQIGRLGLKEDFGWIIVGVLTIAFIWVRPRGILPERRPRYGGRLDATGQPPAGG